jgi:DNA excision repair protein ERCC-2
MNELVKDVADFFPYAEARPFQDQFIKTIFNAVEEGCSIAIQGSNDLGKTIATLSACLPKAFKKNLKILYVARTHRQHDRVIEELENISRKQSVSGLSVRRRHEMCLNRFEECYPGLGREYWYVIPAMKKLPKLLADQ